MMFIDVTRHAGARALRLAVAAIAYVDEVPGGAAVHLVGGESVRVTESPAEIEESCGAMFASATAVIGAFETHSADVGIRTMVEGDIAVVTPAQKGRRK